MTREEADVRVDNLPRMLRLAGRHEDAEALDLLLARMREEARHAALAEREAVCRYVQAEWASYGGGELAGLLREGKHLEEGGPDGKDAR